MNSLQQRELEEMEGLELNEETKERFKITDQEQLNWALRKLSALKVKGNGIDELAAKEIERITSWRTQEQESINHSKSFFEGLIMEYAHNCRKEDPSFKNVKTPYGSIGYRKQQPKWNYDEKLLVSYLEGEELYDYVRVKTEPMKTEIKKQFKVKDGRVYDINGQVVEGITVETLDDALDIKVGIE
jgi:hypothetical protein